MTKHDIMLAALATSEGTTFDAVHLQKLFFLIDKKLGKKVGGPHFHFTAYHYGPFDRDVYEVAEELEGKGLLEILPGRGYRAKSYRLTHKGLNAGKALLASMTTPTAEYIQTLAAWVLELSFDDLVSAIYKAYPAMKKNSVFRG